MTHSKTALVSTFVLLALLTTGCDNRPLEDAENRYFVDATNGSDDNSGLRAAPLKTIQEGVFRVADTGGEVIVAGGEYVGRIYLDSAVTLRGGFDPVEWIQDTGAFPSIVRSPSEFPMWCIGGVGLMTVRVQGFTLIAEDDTPTATTQNTANPISLHNCIDVTIEDNLIVAGRAKDGVDRSGSQPARAARGDDGNDGTNAAFCGGSSVRQPGGAGGSGGPGGNGGRGGSGAGHADGEDTPTAGVSGEIAPGGAAGSGNVGAGRGADGIAGLMHDFRGNGAGGAAFGALQSSIDSPYLAADGASGLTGLPGGGGGGGGGGISSFGFCGGSGGGGAEGGAGGTSGPGGGGGFGSIGILLTGCTDIQIRNNHITTTGGGNGGHGSPGGLGGFGGAGGEGGGGALGLPTVEQGGDGGNGGTGGQGGHGGGGGGGPSVGIAEDAVTSSSRSGNTFEIGPGGAAGAGGNAAEVGLEAEFYKTL